MLSLSFSKKAEETYRVLCLGSHCDDIEIGCGGTILKLIEDYPRIEFYWVVFSSNEERAQEALQSANLFLKEASRKQVIIKNFRDSFFPFVAVEIKEYFESLKQEITPDLILTHYRQDLHLDHRLISELTWATFRDHLILEYEIPKYEGDLGQPNFFVPLDKQYCQRKAQYILSIFKTQQEKRWFSEDVFLSLARLRGIESNAPGKYAEAFYCRKLTFS
ncbi:MAG: PIG-L family deacetylase [Gemmatimonadaceae bacterium]|nr:PIG-L family deacetylase [Gloeobacterales cyanobacterium ES-bin-141]